MLFASCDKLEESACDTKRPLHDLPWLKEQQLQIHKGEIALYKYNGDDVFLVDDCHQCPDASIFVYDCTGNVICEFGGLASVNTCPDFHDQATLIEILFKK